MLIASNAYVMLGAAFGVGAIAVFVGGAAILVTLGRDDRRQALNVLRHPLRTVFSEHEDAEPED
jgi:hypothetical protein